MTPFAVEIEAESYDLALTFRDRAGQLTGEYKAYLSGLDNDVFLSPHDAAGAVTLRLPKGRYVFGAYLIQKDIVGGTLLVQPQLDLTGDQRVAVDARLGKPIEVTVPEPGAAARQTVISYASQLPNDVAGGGLVADAPDGLYTAQLGPQRPATGFTSLISGEWVRVNADGSTDNSPYAYHLAWYEPGRMPNGLTRRLSRRDLATVHAHYAQAIPGSRGMSASFNELPGVPWGIRWADVNLHVDLPFTRDEYYNTDNGVQWESFMTEDVPGNELSISGQTRPVHRVPARPHIRPGLEQGRVRSGLPGAPRPGAVGDPDR